MSNELDEYINKIKRESRQEGERIGREKGKKIGATLIARKLFREGYNFEEVANICDHLNEEELIEIQNEVLNPVITKFQEKSQNNPDLKEALKIGEKIGQIILAKKMFNEGIVLNYIDDFCEDLNRVELIEMEYEIKQKKKMIKTAKNLFRNGEDIEKIAQKCPMLSKKELLEIQKDIVIF